MKPIKTLTCLIILSLGFASYSEAKGRSFGGGFRSQRMAPAPRVQRAPQPQAAPPAQAAPAAQATQPRSMFGSFGRDKPAAAAPQNGQPLNMSKDLNTNAAQGNALKANDARTATGTAGVAGTAAGASNSGWFRSGNPAGAKSAPVQSAAQPSAMQQRGGGGFLNNAMWFMLGSSLARSHQPAANQNTQNENHQGKVANPGDESSLSNVDGPVAEPLADLSPPVEEKESFFMSFLRLALWAAIIFGLYKLVTNVMRAKKNNLNKKPNYTFGN
ncbi:MAG: hypothetical protein V4660_14125 [Pseudomonadota bacterium]